MVESVVDCRKAQVVDIDITENWQGGKNATIQIKSIRLCF
jgi:hypothetical protein